MDYVRLGSTDLKVSRVCLGTWNMSGSPGWGPEDDEKSIDLIRRVQDAGCNFFDTAHVYGRGHAEEVLGRALAADGRRERAVINTKIIQCPVEKVEPSLDEALRLLRTDYVDVYIVHWPRPSLALEPFFEEMRRMVEVGKARHIGVSNFNLEQMRTAVRFGAVSLQPPFNALWRLVEPDVLPFCREHGVSVTPYSPLAQGLLTGRFSRSSEPRTGIRTQNCLFEEPVFGKAREAAAVVDAIADEHGWTSSQTALAWVLQTAGVTAPIVGVSRWSQWQDNVGALEVTLSGQEYARISEAGMAAWRMLPSDATMWGYKPQ
jgi:myo-inositol catabolism protein IolS